MLREMTQFSMAEFLAFKKDTDEMGVSFTPTTSRQKYMAAFLKDFVNTPGFAANIGGVENIQRVRVIGDEMGIERFELVPKLPVGVLRRRQREAEAKEKALKQAKAMAALVFASLLAPVEPAKKEKKRDPAERRRFLMSPEGKKAAYVEALKQDRRQRDQQRKPAKKAA